MDYIVKVIYGMEQYQNEIREFGYDELDKAQEYYNEWLLKKPLKISMYQLLMSDSIMYMKEENK